MVWFCLVGLKESRGREGDLFKLEKNMEVAPLTSLNPELAKLLLDKLIMFDKVGIIGVKIVWCQI